jgi:hypothetical protein
MPELIDNSSIRETERICLQLAKFLVYLMRVVKIESMNIRCFLRVATRTPSGQFTQYPSHFSDLPPSRNPNRPARGGAVPR